MGFIFADPKSASRAQRSQGQNNDNLNWTLPGVLEKKLRQLQAGRNRRTAEATQQPSNNLVGATTLFYRLHTHILLSNRK